MKGMTEIPDCAVLFVCNRDIASDLLQTAER